VFQINYQIILISLVIFWGISCERTKENDSAGQPIPQGPLGKKAAVVTAHPEASKVGIEILKQGGNAFDAAVAVQFALAVSLPKAGNIGGGGFAVLRTASGETNTLDFREKAPLNAYRDMYLDEDSAVIENLSRKSALAVGVPGTVDGMVRLHDQYGSLPFASLLEPAINLARSGVILSSRDARELNKEREEFIKMNDGTVSFYKVDNWEKGDTIYHSDLARTLEQIREKGRMGFYGGWVADSLVSTVNHHHGIISKEDLNAYTGTWRKPIKGTFRGYEVISMPPPSSGGIALVQLLQGAEQLDSRQYDHNSAPYIHLLTEMQRRVYADRATYLGDPDFEDIPAEELLDPDYNRTRFQTIAPDKKTSSQDIKEGNVDVIESHETTHFSIVDEDGNAIAVTTTLNAYFGCKLVVKGAGFVLNNQMDDFSIKPGYPNMFGLVGGEKNAIKPGKRMLSSMTPTLVTKGDDLLMVLGTPGGSTIITTVFQTMLNVIDFGMTMQEAINAKKTHSQWLPDRIYVENGALDSATVKALKGMGHELHYWKQIGRQGCILKLPDGRLEAAADTSRSDGVGLVY
jgi:gamma-glutamyltranspeptidase/glutathione hydrolase